MAAATPRSSISVEDATSNERRQFRYSSAKQAVQWPSVPALHGAPTDSTPGGTQAVRAASPTEGLQPQSEEELLELVLLIRGGRPRSRKPCLMFSLSWGEEEKTPGITEGSSPLSE